MKYISNISIFFIVLLFVSTLVKARPHRPDQLPNGLKNGCSNCHMSPAGGDERNAFGKLVEARFLTSLGEQGDVIWGPLLASLDADNDGITNGEELQDPYGMWSGGQSDPGNSSLVTLPGSAASNSFSTISVNFSNMDPHIGQALYLRIIDKSTNKETGRTKVESITSSFSVQIDAVIPGKSYYIDFFADFNQNNLYDAPPTDHAWRMDLDNAQGNDELNFTHNTNFTDIDWDYVLNFEFASMAPHVGQLLEILIDDNQTGEEVARVRVEGIASADFTLSIPGIKLNHEYDVEFYADLNKNGLYDAPPTDHAWELTFTNNTGDYTLNFTHNTNFTDVEWEYLLTLNLINLSPHVGQKFELRVVNTATSEEIYRTTYDSVPIANFSIMVPDIVLNQDYNINFYADHNGSGSYDAPPADHAWRITFNSGTAGNVVQNFTHNTSFTDIEWTDVTGVKEISGLPESYQLYQNYPNPFNPSTKINFNIEQAGFTKLTIYDILGREIARLVNENLSTGSYEVEWNAAGINSGVYFYKLESGNFLVTKKMMLLK